MDSVTPVLETERLILRAHRVADFEASVAMWSDPAVTRYTIGPPSPPQRTWSRLMSYRGHWELMHYGYWAVEEKSSGDFIGELGIADFKRDNQPLIAGLPEIGWALRPHAHGRGYATEALKAVLQWTDSNLGAAETACIVQRDNHASLRVAEKIGYNTILSAATDDNPETIFIRTRPERSHLRDGVRD
jgi:RimJ/RimL family protein N-acetyltransferase